MNATADFRAKAPEQKPPPAVKLPRARPIDERPDQIPRCPAELVAQRVRAGAVRDVHMVRRASQRILYRGVHAREKAGLSEAPV